MRDRNRLMLLSLFCFALGFGCAHSNEVGMLLEGVCKVAVHMLQSSNAAHFDGGVSDAD